MTELILQEQIEQKGIKYINMFEYIVSNLITIIQHKNIMLNIILF